MKTKIITTALKFLKKAIVWFGILVAILALLSLSVKGEKGYPINFQNELDSKLGGPFESSGSNSRYALTKSIVDTGSLFLNTELAKFASPDLVVYQGRFATLFTPGVSFVAVPFYYVGKLIGLPQLVTFLSSGIYLAISILLIYLISLHFKATKIFSLVAGLIFAFATTALPYSNTLTQHHLSTLLILGSILTVIGKRNFINNLILGILFGLGALVDIPNVFIMAPVGIYALIKHFSIDSDIKKTQLKINPVFVAIIIGLIPLASLFAWYNYQTVGSYTKLAQNIGRTDFFASKEIKDINVKQGGKPGDPSPPLLPFDTRSQINGFYILLISNERGIFYYNPIIIFGILGLILAYRSRINNDLVVLLSAAILVNVLIYSMFGDPWGGWSFGPRYMIPALALLSIGIGYSLSKFDKNPLFVALFIIALSYSVGVNVLGSSTTNLLPPKVEAVNFPDPIPYTYKYNFDLAQKNKSGILIYNLYLKNLISVKTYIYFYSTAILIIIISLFATGLIFRERKLNG